MNTKFDDIFKSRFKEHHTDYTYTEDSTTDLDVSMLLAKNGVPYSHRRIANNFTTLKRVCPFLVVQPSITNIEKKLLTKYDFNTLENTTISTINKEIMLLKDWAISTDDTVREDSVNILKIRIKELKHILSNNYTIKSNEMFKGYKAFEAYISNITNYYK